MELLNNLILVYKKVNNTRKISDPLRIQLRELIVNNFGHDGLRAVTEVEREKKERPVTAAPGKGRMLRRFAHPDQIAKTPVAQVQPVTDNIEDDGTGDDGIGEAGLMVATALGNMAAQNDPGTTNTETTTDQSGEPVQTEQGGTQVVPATDQAGTPEPENTQGEPKLPTQSPILGKPSGNESPASELAVNVKKVAAVNAGEIVSMKPKAAAELYGLESLTQYANENGIEIRPGASATQIAATIITWLKSK